MNDEQLYQGTGRIGSPHYEPGSALFTEPADDTTPFKTLQYIHHPSTDHPIPTDIKVRLILDSVSEYGHRITTMELTYWLMIHQDQQTHRTLWKTDSRKFEEWLDAARSSSSNRALAPARVLEQVENRPYIPLFVASTAQMTGGEYLVGDEYNLAKDRWLLARDDQVRHVKEFDKLPARIHKQNKNRLLTPWQLITTVMTGNEEWWNHFFNLRDHQGAQPDLAVPAGMAHELFSANEPALLATGEWHMPYVTNTLLTARVGNRQTLAKVSAARCARTSYLRQYEELPVVDDVALYDSLCESIPPHDAPREHVVTPIGHNERAGCYVGFASLRAIPL
jgi:hypothetical protein